MRLIWKETQNIQFKLQKQVKKMIDKRPILGWITSEF